MGKNKNSVDIQTHFDAFQSDLVNGATRKYFVLKELKLFVMDDTNRQLKAFKDSRHSWNVLVSSLQEAFIINLGRIFDNWKKNDRHSVRRFLEECKKNIEQFNKNGFIKRRNHKAKSLGLPPLKLDCALVKKASINPEGDIDKINSKVVKAEGIYKEHFMNIRHKAVAHRSVTTTFKEDYDMFSDFDILKAYEILSLLHKVEREMHDMYHNGYLPNTDDDKFENRHKYLEEDIKKLLDKLI